MFPPVDTKNSPAVTAFVQGAFAAMSGSGPSRFLERIFADVEALFAGRHGDYAAVDLRYHDLEHTLQATTCVAQMLAGRHAAGAAPRLKPRDLELAVASALLHDVGYLKLRSDSGGTGAKYTYCHVLRSCAFAASYLPSVGATSAEIDVVIGAISCTGPARQVRQLNSRNRIGHVIGCALVTGDYLGQMAAADYPDELGILFHEFQESDDFAHVPAARRLFRSAHDLAEHTPHFWRDVVRPKLDRDLGGLYRFLAQPYPDGPNAYLAAVEENMARIEASLAATRVPAAATL